MFAHLSICLLGILPIDAVAMDMPSTRAQAVDSSKVEWPLGVPVRATVHGQSTQTAQGGLDCIYAEWVLGRTTGPADAGKWIQFDAPVQSQSRLRIVSGSLVLEAMSGGIHFSLPPAQSKHWPADQASVPPQVAAFRKDYPGPVTQRQYCLVDGAEVQVTRILARALLPPVVAGGEPVEEHFERIHVEVPSSAAEQTPASSLP